MYKSTFEAFTGGNSLKYIGSVFPVSEKRVCQTDPFQYRNSKSMLG
jgi:hypothetical protein